MSPLLRVYLIFLFPLLVNECLLRSTYSCPEDHYNVEESVIVARYSTPSSNHSKSWRRRILSSSWFDFCLPLMSIDCSSPSVPRNPLFHSLMIYRQKVDCNSILQVQSIGILLMALPSQFPVYPHPPSLRLLLHLRPNSTLCMSPVNGTEHGAPTLSMSPRLSSALLRRALSQISLLNDRTLLSSCMSLFARVPCLSSPERPNTTECGLLLTMGGSTRI